MRLNQTRALKAGNVLIPIENVTKIDISSVEHEEVRIYTAQEIHTAYGFDAIEAVMLFKPSSLEGRRLRWKRNAWAFHNLVGHPIVQIIAWMGFKKQAVRFHDWTTPTPRGFKMRA